MTSNTKKTIIYLFFLAIISIISCKTDLSKIKPPENISQRPQLSVENFHSRYKMSSLLRAEIFAPIMDRYTINKNYIEFNKGVDIRFFDIGFEPTTTLVSKYAITYPDEELWVFRDSVVITSNQGGTLKTEELFFNQRTQKIYSVKYVEVTDTSGSIIRGKGGFESNYDFTIYEFKNVDGTIITTDNVESNSLL